MWTHQHRFPARPVSASYSRVNGLKIHNQWLKIMRLAKVESLRKDIEILSQSHEREVDRKDAIIQMLDKDLEVRPSGRLAQQVRRPVSPTNPERSCVARHPTRRTRRSSTSWRSGATSCSWTRSSTSSTAA